MQDFLTEGGQSSVITTTKSVACVDHARRRTDPQIGEERDWEKHGQNDVAVPCSVGVTHVIVQVLLLQVAADSDLRLVGHAGQVG